jgi:hypothetical protein
MSRQCIFCGRRPVTREHVFPAWVSALGTQSGSVLHTLTRDNDTETYRFPAEGRLQFKAKVVCRRCNNEWMNDLDRRVEPLLRPLAAGEARTFTEEKDVELIAAWGTKMAIMLDQLRGRSDLTRKRGLIPENLRQAFYVTKRPPPDVVHVWLACFDARPVQMVWWRTTPLVIIPVDPRLYGGPYAELVTFVVNWLVVQVLFAPAQPQFQKLASDRTWGPHTSPYISGVWPVAASQLDWPPDLNLSERGLENFSVA